MCTITSRKLKADLEVQSMKYKGYQILYVLNVECHSCEIKKSPELLDTHLQHDSLMLDFSAGDRVLIILDNILALPVGSL